jgi:5'-nucleotidase
VDVPRILVTNDDGIFSEGIKLLASALSELAEVWVVAPDREQSAASHAISLHRPLRIKEVRERWYSVDGTPTDCAYLAIHHLLKDRRPDLMVSGINHGANLADDVTYSGTVAAAFEGIILGVPAIAISQQSSKGEMGFMPGRTFDFSFAASLAARLVEKIRVEPLAEGTLLNVNVPAGEPAGLEVTKLGKRLYDDEMKLVEEDDKGRRRYRIYGFEPSFEDEPGTDLAALARGKAALTPIHFDLTHHDGLDGLEAWDTGDLLRAAMEAAASA